MGKMAQLYLEYQEVQVALEQLSIQELHSLQPSKYDWIINNLIKTKENEQELEDYLRHEDKTK
jgi:hypothetical protein